MSYSYQPQKLVEEFRIFKETLEKHPETTSSSIENSTHAIDRQQGESSFVVASIQFTASGFPSSTVAKFWTIVENSIQKAAEMGAELILVPELFLGPYFCQSREACLMELAWENVEECLLVQKMQVLAMKYSVVLPVSLFERDNNALFNTVVMLDADGKVLGKYRKSHIPDGTGYQEKFYFSPGDTGFKVWDTQVGKVGVAICWDQWFPEAARAMALQGADVLLYPTAIGSEPQDSTIDSSDHWQRVMQGHAAANVSVGIGQQTCFAVRHAI
jgi:N-carbamoylputrescine amidase